MYILPVLMYWATCLVSTDLNMSMVKGCFKFLAKQVDPVLTYRLSSNFTVNFFLCSVMSDRQKHPDTRLCVLCILGAVP
uniref:Secreted protein n=1 Tax=Anguilla anguilla TaxID=7936 RepID=A0A0E9WJQ3_ANGAN